jgi:ankyrin repeat protein
VARGGGRNWTPLFYLCAARFRRGDAEAARHRSRIGSRLIELGADPKEEVADSVAPGGFRSLLQAAAADVASEELVSFLIERGALLEPTGAAAGTVFPLSDAVIGGNPLCVRRILEAKPPTWEAREALELAILHDDLTSVQLLLAYGAEANGAGRWWGQHGSCLHSAILLGRGRELLEALLAGGVDISVRDSDRRTAYQAAVRTRHDCAVELLQKHGASDVELDDVDRLIAACVAGDREALRAAETRSKPRFRRTDHQFLCWAIRHGHHAAVPLLLEVGLDPNVPDDHGETALHLAVKSGHAATIAALRARGANADARNFLGQTPFDDALDPDARRSQDELFERAVTAVVEGKLEELREMLDEEPDLVHARSRRSHRATLLHYVAANGTERQEVPPNAPQVAEVLLERGAVADAECHMYGGGQTTLGLAISSVFPERAGLTGDLVRVLVRGGARVGGLDDEGHPLSGAIDCGSRLGVEALVECGATETLAAAAALGHVERLEQRLELEPQMAGAALVVAAKFGQVAVLEKLLARGVDVNSRPAQRGWPDGVTALHQAAWHGKIDAVRCLLDHGADPTLRDSTHHGTPAGWASHSGNHAIAELISSREQPSRE